MQAGKRPWPIAVRPAWSDRFGRGDRQNGNIWQRLDGFKRYMAHRALGLSSIECFIVADNKPGCQHGHAAFVSDSDELPPGFDRDFFVEAGPDRLSLVASDEQRRLANEVELLRNGTIHVHLGDTRLEFERAQFIAFATMIQQAHAAL
jgi:hypothetical protein